MIRALGPTSKECVTKLILKAAKIVITSNNNDHCQRECVKGINNRFEFRPTDSGQVLKLLNKLNKSKGAGLDKLSSRLIRECADLVLPYISTILNCCLTTGISLMIGNWPKLRLYSSKAIERDEMIRHEIEWSMLLSFRVQIWLLSSVEFLCFA